MKPRDGLTGYKIRRRMGWPRRCAFFGCAVDKKHPIYPNVWAAYCRRCGRRFVPRGGAA